MIEIIVTALVDESDADKYTSFIINALTSRTKTLEEISHNSAQHSKTEVILHTDTDRSPESLGSYFDKLSDCGVVTFTRKPTIVITDKSKESKYRYTINKHNNYMKVST